MKLREVKVWQHSHHNKKNKLKEELLRDRVSNKFERRYIGGESTSQTPSMCWELYVCSLCVANSSLKSNIKTAKVSPAVCSRGSSEHISQINAYKGHIFNQYVYSGRDPIHLHDCMCYSKTFFFLFFPLYLLSLQTHAVYVLSMNSFRRFSDVGI